MLTSPRSRRLESIHGTDNYKSRCLLSDSISSPSTKPNIPLVSHLLRPVRHYKQVQRRRSKQQAERVYVRASLTHSSSRLTPSAHSRNRQDFIILSHVESNTALVVSFSIALLYHSSPFTVDTLVPLRHHSGPQHRTQKHASSKSTGLFGNPMTLLRHTRIQPANTNTLLPVTS